MSIGDILIAGAGIGGLTAALALARRGMPVTLFDQATQLEEAGAGLQLSPNATAVLTGLNLADRLRPGIVAPEAVRLRSGDSGRDIVTMRLDAGATGRPPYWVIHRADLQKALLDAVAAEPLVRLVLGTRVDDVTIDASGVRVKLRCGSVPAAECTGAVLIGADGLRSTLRARLGDPTEPRFAGRTAWRAVVGAAELAPPHRTPIVNLWIGPGGHLVHYPIRAGTAVNIVAVAGARWRSPAWSTHADRDEVLDRFPAAAWAGAARDLLAAPQRWQKWALYDRDPAARWGRGAVTLLGDAAHPMLPFLAQGAAMAIEDAAVLAAELSRGPGDPAAALRRYESARRPRTARVQRAARRNDFGYHVGAPANHIRNAALRVLGGTRLLAQYEWIYGWRP